MSLDSQEIDELVDLGLPILCVDTCALLDLIRDITSSFKAIGYLAQGLELLEFAEGGDAFIVLMSEVVSDEVGANVEAVEQTAKEGLLKFIAEAERIHKLVTLFGAEGDLGICHIDGHVHRAKGVFDRWRDIARLVPGNDDVNRGALKRLMESRSPSRKGKDSTKDCLIVEAYIELATKLRAAGFEAPIIFISSNTSEYFETNTKTLKSDIASDLNSVSLGFAPNFAVAKRLLKL